MNDGPVTRIEYAGTEVKVEGEELKIMRESDLLGILQ